MKFLYIAVFGLLGVFGRYWAGAWVGSRWPGSFPLGTLLINLGGSFLIGVVWAAGKEYGALPEDLRVGLTVGFLGGFTTFSSYMFETSRLLETGQQGMAALYLGLSTALGLACAFGGLNLTRLLLRG